MSFLLLAAVFTPLLAAMLAPWLGRLLQAKAGWVLAAAFAPALLLVTQIPAARSGQPFSADLAWVPALGLSLGLRADGFSLLFALIVALIGVLVMCYAASYLGARESHGRFYAYLLSFGGSMLGLVLADNLIALFAFWELTSISSFLLIGYWDYRRASQDGALKALIITAIGGLALLIAVILLIQAGGSVRLSELDVAALRQSPQFVPAMWLLLLAAFSKSAQLPFHLWLPTAMEAPTPVSAYLHSATMVKAGVVLVAKVGVLFVDTAFADFIMYVGLLTMFWGSYLAIRQHDLKALLAYSTVSQLGLLMALYGSGHSFAATTHLLNHAAFKACLFLVVGIIDHETGSRDLRKLSGLRHKLPITTAFAVLAALSMAGLPPLGGFVSKELFYEAMLHQGFWPIAIAVTGSMMTLCYSLRFLQVFWGDFQAEKPHIHEAPVALWWPLLPLSAMALLMGLFPGIAQASAAVAASSLGFHPEHLALWHGFTLSLWLSLLTWLGGGLLLYYRELFVAWQLRLTPTWNANTVYYLALGWLERSAYRFTRATQDATFAGHIRLLWLPVALAGWFLTIWALPRLQHISLIPLEFYILAVAIGASVLGVMVARTRLSALIFMGLAGFASTLAFVLLRAPDLALTQLLIETITVILFLSVFRYLPALTRYRRPTPVVLVDATLAATVGLAVFTGLLVVQTPIAERIQGFFLDSSQSLAGGANVVNVILVDFRGYDTMGEISVLSIVAVTIYALLRLTPKSADKVVLEQEDPVCGTRSSASQPDES